MYEPVDRVPCCVPTCRRFRGAEAWKKRFGSAPDEGCEFICQQHWKKVPQRMRRVHARIRRRERTFGCSLPAGLRIWRRLRTEAIRISEGPSVQQ